MRLARYRVTNFRSVGDSGWIDIQHVTAFIGVNESGKTNLLVPLWKLNPAREGDLQPTSDYPKKLFGVIREEPEAFCFIEAEFATGELAAKIARVADRPAEEFEVVNVKRYFDSNYVISFPKHEPPRELVANELTTSLKAALRDIEAAQQPTAIFKRRRLTTS